MTRSRFRDQRVFHVDDPAGQAGGWYFEVRDGPPRGPYATQGLAGRALADFLEGREASPRPRDGDGTEGTDAGQ